ncbi:MAG: MBL fold metallo-hydrolase [Candidatus Cryptobacteroides sp.]
MMIRIYTFQFNPFQECCSLVWDKSGEAVIIDPGFYNAAEAETLYRKIASENLVPKMILLTHGHFDHIFGVKECAVKYSIPVMMNRADNIILENDGAIAAAFGLRAPDVDFVTLPLEDGQSVAFGETVFKVIATPGHTPGGVCFYDEADKVLFSGDTLFAGSIGRTDNAWGDYDSLIKCIMEKLMGLDGDVSIIPGHGPQTNIGRERTHNPFLQPFNEPEPDELDWDADGIELKGGEL